VKKDHPTFDRISQLYVLNINEDKCVEYKFHESERPLIKIDISGAPGEIEIEQTLDNVHNLKFDDTDTYNKENVARKYKRKQPGVLQNVNTNASSRTKCYGKGGQKIEPCPTQVPTAGRTTIAVNYKDGDRCKPMD
jgi:hypothetical protein